MTEDTLTPPPPRERWMKQPTKATLRGELARVTAENIQLRRALEGRWLRRVLRRLLKPRKQWLWHPDSPGVKVLVVRTRIGRAFKSKDFATLSEPWLIDSPALPPLLEQRTVAEPEADHG